MAAPKSASIPVPVKGNPDSVHETLMALKQVVEQLLGTRGDQPAGRTFVQEKVPTAVSTGDRWIQPLNGNESYWNGNQWIIL